MAEISRDNTPYLVPFDAPQFCDAPCRQRHRHPHNQQDAHPQKRQKYADLRESRG